jgi:pyridoxamine 5'-phosphate oxidase family protein
MEFTPEEKEYLSSQRLARIGTASADGRPDVAPVGFRFDGDSFWIGGMDLPNTLKYKNVRANPVASVVVDDLASVDPWRPRLVKVRGPAEIVERNGRDVIHVTPERKWSYGIGPE